MDTNENVKKDIVNEQKNLIAKSVKELSDYYDHARMYYTIEHPSYQLEHLPTADRYITIATDELLSKSKIIHHKMHKFTSVKLNNVSKDEEWIIFKYEILNWRY